MPGVIVSDKPVRALRSAGNPHNGPARRGNITNKSKAIGKPCAINVSVRLTGARQSRCPASADRWSASSAPPSSRSAGIAATAANIDCVERNGVMSMNVARQTTSVPSRRARDSMNLMPQSTNRKATLGSRPRKYPYHCRIASAAASAKTASVHDGSCTTNASGRARGRHVTAKRRPTSNRPMTEMPNGRCAACGSIAATSSAPSQRT